jgi:polar amino acid transport system substrate-binding protein
MRRTVAVVAALLSAALIAGCSSSDRAQRMALAALNTPVVPQPTAPPSPPGPSCRNLTASLRPPAVLPTPGAMPAGGYMAEIERRGYLIAGVDQNTLLFAYFNPLEDKLEGFEIDLLRDIAQAIFGNPDKIVFKAITTDERIPAVQDQSVDLVADAVTITCARRQQVDFSSVYYDAGQKLLVPSNSTVRSVKDLGGEPVCATIGSTSLWTLEHQHPEPKPYQVQQRTDCLVALEQGKVDAITSDDSILLGFKAQDPQTKIVGPSFAPEPYGIAINKAHPDFVRFVNGVLAQMRADGAWRALYKRWLGPKPPTPPTATYDG